LIEQYGFLYANPALNLLQSAKQGKYCGIIHNVGLLEFFCIYWRIENLLYRNRRNRRNRKKRSNRTINATDDIIKIEIQSKYESVFNQCMFINLDGNISVFQIVSADHKVV